MRRILLVALGCVSLTGALDAANPQKKEQVYVVTHVDVFGRGSGLDDAIKMLHELEADSRKEPGSVRFEVVQQDGHANHFTIFEVWENQKAYDAHSIAEHTRHFREKLQPMLGSPYNDRVHNLVH